MLHIDGGPIMPPASGVLMANGVGPAIHLDSIPYFVEVMRSLAGALRANGSPALADVIDEHLKYTVI